MQTKYKIAIGVVIVGAIGAGVVGYLINKQSNCDNCVNETNLDINEAGEPASASPQSVPSKTVGTSPSDYLYQNEAFNFKITLSEAWKGYTVTQKKSDDPSAEAQFDFVLPLSTSSATALKIFVYKTAAWPNASKEIAPIKLLENAAYVYAYKTWDSPPADLGQITEKEIADRLKTFALIK